MNRRFVRMIDLVDEADRIAAYERAHSPGHTPPEVLAAQRRNGIAELEIYRLGTRLVMVMEVTDAFDPDALDRETRADPVLIEWQQRMGAIQRPVAGQQGWAEMPCIFRQTDHP